MTSDQAYSRLDPHRRATKEILVLDTEGVDERCVQHAHRRQGTHSRRRVIPAVYQVVSRYDFRALATAEAALSRDQRLVVLGVIDLLEHVYVDPIAAQTEAARLAEVVARMEQPIDMAAAHVLAVSQHLDRPILTADASRWDSIKGHLPWRIDPIEIADLE